MTTTITIPIKKEHFAPDLTNEIENMELLWKDYNWMGRIIYWIRHSEGIIKRTVVLSISMLVSVVLMVSVIGVPLLVYAAQELTRQQERSIFDKKLKRLKSLITDFNQLHFLNGRLGLFNGASISLSSGTRRQIIQDLQLLGITDDKSKVPLRDLSNSALLHMILGKDVDTLAKYNLKVYG